MAILSIDPGTLQSAYSILDESLRPIKFGKIDNEELLYLINNYKDTKDDYFAIEMVACYGVAVGKSVFETVFWIGRFWQASEFLHKKKIFRKQDVCINLCNTVKAKDSNIKTALVDRFAKHDLERGKGTIKNPDWFYGVSKDVWSAIAVGVTFNDLYLTGNKPMNENYVNLDLCDMIGKKKEEI